MQLNIKLSKEVKDRNEVLQNSLVKNLLSRSPKEAAEWSTAEKTKPAEKDALIKALTKAVVYLLSEKNDTTSPKKRL